MTIFLKNLKILNGYLLRAGEKCTGSALFKNSNHFSSILNKILSYGNKFMTLQSLKIVNSHQKFRIYLQALKNY
jgi:hypothetical protein